MKRKFALIEQVSKKSQQTNQSTIIIHQSKISPKVYIYTFPHPLLFCSQGFGHTRSERCGWSTRRLVHRGASQLRCSWNPSWVATVLSLISTPCRYKKILFVWGGYTWSNLHFMWHTFTYYISMYKNMYICVIIILHYHVQYNYDYNDHHHHHHHHVFIITPLLSPSINFQDKSIAISMALPWHQISLHCRACPSRFIKHPGMALASWWWTTSVQQQGIRLHEFASAHMFSEEAGVYR